jgi:hypothetical protein
LFEFDGFFAAGGDQPSLFCFSAPGCGHSDPAANPAASVAATCGRFSA